MQPHDKQEAYWLRGKVAVVTGSGKGIGRDIARTLASRGAALVLADIDDGALHATVDEFRDEGLRVTGTRFDLGDRNEAELPIAHAIEQFGHLDILVNNASTWSNRPLEGAAGVRSEWRDWERAFLVNAVGTLAISRAAAGAMRHRGSGSIVQITSIHQQLVRRLHVEYSMSKAAQRMLIQELAVEYAPWNIRVNGVAPGDIDVSGSLTATAPNKYVPLGRHAGSPVDVAEVVAFLCDSQKCRYVTGTTIDVSGGLHLYSHCVDLMPPGIAIGTGGSARHE